MAVEAYLTTATSVQKNFILLYNREIEITVTASKMYLTCNGQGNLRTITVYFLQQICNAY
jgi:hypothetical protein